MCPAPLNTLEPGQLFYNIEHDQHAVFVGHNGIGWLLQYEDGDVVEIGAPFSHQYMTDNMVYKPESPEIEQRRPTMDAACSPTEHVFFTDPLHITEIDIESLRCAKCGLEYEILADDMDHWPDVENQIPSKCDHCEGNIPPGKKCHFTFDDFYTCADCHDHLKEISWAEYEQSPNPIDDENTDTEQTTTTTTMIQPTQEEIQDGLKRAIETDDHITYVSRRDKGHLTTIEIAGFRERDYYLVRWYVPHKYADVGEFVIPGDPKDMSDKNLGDGIPEVREMDGEESVTTERDLGERIRSGAQDIRSAIHNNSQYLTAPTEPFELMLIQDQDGYNTDDSIVYVLTTGVQIL